MPALCCLGRQKAIRLIDRFAACFRDGRHPAYEVRTLVAQRVLGLALGYEDLVDHDEVRRDPVLGGMLGKLERGAEAPAPLAGKSRIKEAQGDLFADRTAAATMCAHQLRLWFASMAYVLLCALRRIGLAHTQFAAATCGTIRLKPLKIGALVKISARRVKIAFASACPSAAEWRLAAARLAHARLPVRIRAAARVVLAAHPQDPETSASPRHRSREPCHRPARHPPISLAVSPATATELRGREKCGLAAAGGQ
jgi:hypothetical protein